MIWRAISAFVCALLAGTAHARDTDDAQIWLSAGTSGSLAGPLELHADGALRWYDSGAHLGHLQVRGMLAWRFSRSLMLGAGYTYVRNTAVGGRSTHEHRPFQQLNFPIASLGAAQLVGRTRLEQRFFEERSGLTWRLRQQVRLNIPLEGPDGLRAIIHVEPYFVLNRIGPNLPTGLNQVRSFAGLGIPLGGYTTLEAGYMNQAFAIADRRVNHALSLGLSRGF